MMNTNINAPPENSKTIEPQMTDHQLAEEMARASPDGRPTEPVLRKKGMYGMMLAIVLLMMLGGGLIWLFTNNLALAGAVTGFVLLGAILSSPALISGIMRANERDRVEHGKPVAPNEAPHPHPPA